MAESQAAIWLSLAQGSRGLCGVGLVAGWGQGHWGRLCVCDDSRPMITACAHVGSVNRREGGGGSEEKENCGWEGGLRGAPA